MSLIKRNLVSIPISVVHSALQKSEINVSTKKSLLKENLIEYYNNKLLYLLRFERWPEFFYTYESASVLNHGVNNVSHVIAAHGYIMAYQNTSKASLILAKASDGPAKSLCYNIFETYNELKRMGIQPASPDWAVIVNLTAAVAAGKPANNKWHTLMGSNRTPWHMQLRPWKYPRHVNDEKEDYKYKFRGDK